MKDPRITDLVKEEAEKMYKESGCLNLWMLSRRIARSIGVSDEIIVLNLIRLGYVEIVQGAFVLKGDRETPTAKKIRSLDGTAFSFMVSNQMAQEPVIQDSIQQTDKKVDYTAYKINELRSIALGKGIKDAFFLTKEALIKRIKAKLRG